MFALSVLTVLYLNTQRADYGEAVPLGVNFAGKFSDSLPQPPSRPINMATLTYSLLPTQNLVVYHASEHKRVEFSPLEIRQAVEAGAILAKEMEGTNLLDNLCKRLQF